MENAIRRFAFFLMMPSLKEFTRQPRESTKATAREISMPIEALIGIGLMYGPIKPDTNAIGNKAAITVRVARMVGPPTSSTAGE